MRLFVAIELDKLGRAALTDLQNGLRAAAAQGVRWVTPGQLHLTVKFLGEVDDRRVPEVTDAVSAAAERGRPFDFELLNCGCFPPGGNVRIVWAGLHEPTGILASSVEAFEAEFERIGFPRERRPFSPHLTIGRVREDRSRGRIRSLVEQASFGPVAQSATGVTLMQSVLSPQGPTYTPISQPEFGETLKCRTEEK